MVERDACRVDGFRDGGFDGDVALDTYLFIMGFFGNSAIWQAECLGLFGGGVGDYVFRPVVGACVQALVPPAKALFQS